MGNIGAKIQADPHALVAVDHNRLIDQFESLKSI